MPSNGSFVLVAGDCPSSIPEDVSDVMMKSHSIWRVGRAETKSIRRVHIPHIYCWKVELCQSAKSICGYKNGTKTKWVQEGEFTVFSEPPLKDITPCNPSRVKRWLEEQEGANKKKNASGGGGKRKKGYADVIIDALLTLKPPVSRSSVKQYCADALHIDHDNDNVTRRFDIAMEQAMELGVEKKWWEEIKGSYYKLASDWKKKRGGGGRDTSREEIKKRLEEARGRMRMGFLRRQIDGVTKGYPVPDEELKKATPTLKPMGNDKYKGLGSVVGDIMFIHGVVMGKLGIKEIGLTPIFKLDHVLSAFQDIALGSVQPLISALATQLLVMVVDPILGKGDVGQSVFGNGGVVDGFRDEAEERFAGSKDLLKIISPVTWPAALSIYLENQALFFEHRKNIEKETLAVMDENKKLKEERDSAKDAGIPNGSTPTKIPKPEGESSSFPPTPSAAPTTPSTPTASSAVEAYDDDSYFGKPSSTIARAYNKLWKMEPETLTIKEIVALLRILAEDVVAKLLPAEMDRRASALFNLKREYNKLCNISKKMRTKLENDQKEELANHKVGKKWERKKYTISSGNVRGNPTMEDVEKWEKDAITTERSLFAMSSAKLIRTDRLGEDKDWNTYWWFDNDEERVWVESREGGWSYYETQVEFDKLVESLDKKGERELVLLETLKDHQGVVRKKMKSSRKKRTIGAVERSSPRFNYDGYVLEMATLGKLKVDLPEKAIKSIVVKVSEYFLPKTTGNPNEGGANVGAAANGGAGAENGGATSPARPQKRQATASRGSPVPGSVYLTEEEKGELSVEKKALEKVGTLSVLEFDHGFSESNPPSKHVRKGLKVADYEFGEIHDHKVTSVWQEDGVHIIVGELLHAESQVGMVCSMESREREKWRKNVKAIQKGFDDAITNKMIDVGTNVSDSKLTKHWLKELREPIIRLEKHVYEQAGGLCVDDCWEIDSAIVLEAETDEARQARRERRYEREMRKKMFDIKSVYNNIPYRGFHRSAYWRKDRDKADMTFYTPEGVRLRSRADVERYVKDEFGVRGGPDKPLADGRPIDIDEFDFTTPDRSEVHIFLKPDDLKQKALAAMDDGGSDDDDYDSEEDEDDTWDGVEALEISKRMTGVVGALNREDRLAWIQEVKRAETVAVFSTLIFSLVDRLNDVLVNMQNGEDVLNERLYGKDAIVRAERVERKNGTAGDSGRKMRSRGKLDDISRRNSSTYMPIRTWTRASPVQTFYWGKIQGAWWPLILHEAESAETREKLDENDWCLVSIVGEHELYLFERQAIENRALFDENWGVLKVPGRAHMRMQDLSKKERRERANLVSKIGITMMEGGVGKGVSVGEEAKGYLRRRWKEETKRVVEGGGEGGVEAMDVA